MNDQNINSKSLYKNIKAPIDQEIIRDNKLKNLQKEKDPFLIENIENNISIKDVLKNINSLFNDARPIKVCGRIITIRSRFFNISEEHNILQCYLINQDNLSRYFTNFVDIGDIVELEGVLFETKTKNLTLKVNSISIVSKCLKPLPEKYHGIKNEEIQIRNRVGNILVNDDLFQTLRLRSKIIWLIRVFLNNLDYLEVETPIFHNIAGGAVAKPFITKFNSLNKNLFLRIAPELYLKRLIISGYTKIFELGRSFRNESIDSTHNPEFTSLEIYTAYFGLTKTIDLTEQLIKYIYNNLEPELKEKNESLKKEFKKISISQLVFEKTGFDFYNEDNKITIEKAIELCSLHKIILLESEKTKGKILHKLFEELVEHELIDPTFVYGYHKDVSPLAKTDDQNHHFTKRFELFIGGKEIANGFAELNDPIDQLERFKYQNENNVDYSYVEDLKYGLPPTGGVGIGIDRLVMLIVGVSSIKNVLSFPYCKIEKK